MSFKIRLKRLAMLRLATCTVTTCTAMVVATPYALGQTALSDAERMALERSLQADLAAAPTPTAVTGPTTFADTMNMSLILDVAAAAFTSRSPLQLGGHDPKSSGFNLQGLEFHYDTNIDPYFRLDVNLVFAPDGFELEEAFGSTLALPGSLSVRAGKFLTQFGRANPVHMHGWSFVDQPLVNRKFMGPDGSRGLGTEVAWLAPLPWFLRASLSATDARGDCCARSFLNDDEREARDPADLLYTGAVQQFIAFSDDWGLLFGLSTQQGPQQSEPGARAALYGADVNLRWRPVADPNRKSVTLQAEWLLRTRELGNRTLRDHGGYAHLVWALAPRWEVGARAEYTTGLQDDPLDPDETATRNRNALQVTFYPSHFSRLRLQGMRDDAAWRPRPDWGVMLALEVVGGAHGAHVY